MRVQVFQPADVKGFPLQAAQCAQFEDQAAWQSTAKTLAAPGNAYTLKRSNGAAVAMCGLYPVDAGYALGWAFLARDLGALMVPITRIVKRYLDARMETYRRIEMNTHAEFEEGVRWAQTLGFEIEGVMRSAAPDGGDLIRLVRLGKGIR